MSTANIRTRQDYAGRTVTMSRSTNALPDMQLTITSRACHDAVTVTEWSVSSLRVTGGPAPPNPE